MAGRVEIFVYEPMRAGMQRRAVDQEGEIRDLLVQSRRDKRATVRLMRKLLRKQGFAPRVAVTDKLRSYAGALALSN